MMMGREILASSNGEPGFISINEPSNKEITPPIVSKPMTYDFNFQQKKNRARK
jgi:hypothetical protein